VGVAVLELGQRQFELRGAAECPEEVRVWRGEVVKEELASRQQLIGDREVLEQTSVASLFTLSSAPGTSQTRGGELIRARNGWMPEAHHDISEIAFNSCQGSAGISLACGKVRAIQSWIAALSLSTWPSTTSSGTLCFGLSFR